MKCWTDALTALIILLFGLTDCQQDGPVASDHPGAALATTYCGSCHRVPDPQDLPTYIWKTELLPKMGAFLGKYGNKNRMHYLVSAQTAPYLEPLYPKVPAIDSGDWAQLRDYYLTESPETVPEPPQPPAIRKLKQFAVHAVPAPLPVTDAPYTTLLEFDSVRQQIIVGSAGRNGGRLRTFDANHRLTGDRCIGSAPSDVNPLTGELLTMGSLVPSDLPRGMLTVARSDSSIVLLDTLARPVAMTRIDLDRDGTKELVVAEFGNMVGALNAYTPNADGTLRLQRTLRAKSGALRLRKTDLDRDGWPDLVVLSGQGDESVVVYYSRPGTVESEVLLRFPPSYGSSDLELTDVNDDGFVDLVCTNGDNFDYPPFPKTYHGLRIYENDGNNQFSAAHFFALNGAYNVEAADFDGDGDVDLAVLAYFVPERLRPTHSFVYLERTWGLGTYNFKAYGFPKPAGVHYLTMTQGDVDRDGDIDLLLGNFAAYLPNGIVSDVDKTGALPAYLFLENGGAAGAR